MKEEVRQIREDKICIHCIMETFCTNEGSGYIYCEGIKEGCKFYSENSRIIIGGGNGM